LSKSIQQFYYDKDSQVHYIEERKKEKIMELKIHAIFVILSNGLNLMVCNTHPFAPGVSPA
ncbi:13689_t:CDS:2, partial [Gigaspora rosea]